jgi:hypothetical protein
MSNIQFSGQSILKKVIFVTFVIGYLSTLALTNINSDQDFFKSDYIRFSNHCYNDNIKTVKIHVLDDPLSIPIIELSGSDKLLLSFDELNGEVKDYTYRFYHCTSKWEKSDLFTSDYIDGFEENQIRDAEMSFNTKQSYIHYSLSFPNDDIKLLLSGNYVIAVYDAYEEEKLVLTRRFHVIEPGATIAGEAKRATNLDFHRSHHEVDFTFWSNIPINDPYQDIKICVIQNGRWDNVISDISPKYIKGNEFIYDYEDEILFPAAGEFRHFNSKDIKFASEGIKSIQYRELFYHFDLEKSELRRFKVYKYKEDINGKLFIDVANGQDNELEADYVISHFSLSMDAPVVDGNIYVFGELSNWEFPMINRMSYNYEKKAYELEIPLKQGYYDYTYAFIRDGEVSADIGYIEGNHYETENDYHIFIYYRDNSSRYDKLIGVSTVNTTRKN